MKNAFAVIYEGIDGRVVTRFPTIIELQKYVQDQWEGTDYIDGPDSFHNDFGCFYLGGATLYDLGDRGGRPGTDEWFDWTWRDLATFTPPRLKKEK